MPAGMSRECSALSNCDDKTGMRHVCAYARRFFVFKAPSVQLIELAARLLQALAHVEVQERTYGLWEAGAVPNLRTCTLAEDQAPKKI